MINTNTVVEVRYLCKYFDYNENVFQFYILEPLSLEPNSNSALGILYFIINLYLSISCVSLVGQKPWICAPSIRLSLTKATV